MLKKVFATIFPQVPINFKKTKKKKSFNIMQGSGNWLKEFFGINWILIIYYSVWNLMRQLTSDNVDVRLLSIDSYLRKMTNVRLTLCVIFRYRRRQLTWRVCDDVFWRFWRYSRFFDFIWCFFWRIWKIKKFEILFKLNWQNFC